ncbi:MAG: hypothetical protein ABI903_13170 [Actinomycetota bacterium]
MVINARSASGIAAIWLAAVVGVSATAWVAIDRAGRDITNVNIKTMAPAPVITPAIAPRPTSTPLPSATSTLSVAPPPASRPSTEPAPATTSDPTPAPSRTTRDRHVRHPEPTPQDRTIRVAGGVVSVRCTGTAIRLRIAQPEYEWRVHVDTPTAGKIVVSFRMGDEESQRRTQVTAVCTQGSPAFTVSGG